MRRQHTEHREPNDKRLCCIHEALHSRRMEGIHTGRVERPAAPAAVEPQRPLGERPAR